MRDRKIRILLGQLGKGRKESQLSLARNFGEAGFEVIYTELQDPDSIVSSALQESVDHIGITILPDADIHAFARIRELLKKENCEYITITAGGFLEDSKIPLLKDMGVVEFFPQGTSFDDLIEWSKKNIKNVD